MPGTGETLSQATEGLRNLREETVGVQRDFEAMQQSGARTAPAPYVRRPEDVVHGMSAAERMAAAERARQDIAERRAQHAAEPVQPLARPRTPEEEEHWQALRAQTQERREERETIARWEADREAREARAADAAQRSRELQRQETEAAGHAGRAEAPGLMEGMFGGAARAMGISPTLTAAAVGYMAYEKTTQNVRDFGDMLETVNRGPMGEFAGAMMSDFRAALDLMTGRPFAAAGDFYRGWLQEREGAQRIGLDIPGTAGRGAASGWPSAEALNWEATLDIVTGRPGTGAEIMGGVGGRPEILRRRLSAGLGMEVRGPEDIIAWAQRHKGPLGIGEQARLEAMMGPYAADIMAFAQMPPEQQEQVLEEIRGLPPVSEETIGIARRGAAETARVQQEWRRSQLRVAAEAEQRRQENRAFYRGDPGAVQSVTVPYSPLEPYPVRQYFPTRRPLGELPPPQQIEGAVESGGLVVGSVNVEIEPNRMARAVGAQIGGRMARGVVNGAR